jgi:3-deoxy-D-manno-octulosonate 8-phosphate phosphatase KdsC-like HAD superfamily phosphatase
MLTDTLVFLLIGVEAEGSEIPSAVPVEDVAPGTQEATAEAPELMEVAARGAAAMTGVGGDDALPEPALEVVVLSLEIQDAEPIRSAPMTEAATSSRGGIELLADDLVDPATVARHLEAVRQAEQWMKVSSHNS